MFDNILFKNYNINMKLKMYRISLIITLIISACVTLLFGIISTINVTNFDQIKLTDGIMYILCYVLLLVFTILEIINTILSFKNGSVYIRGLAYNDNKEINRNTLTITGGIVIISLFAIVYLLIILSGANIPLSTLDIEAIYFMICTSILVIINATYVLLFPILAFDDQSLHE